MSIVLGLLGTRGTVVRGLAEWLDSVWQWILDLVIGGAWRELGRRRWWSGLTRV